MIQGYVLELEKLEQGKKDIVANRKFVKTLQEILRQTTCAASVKAELHDVLRKTELCVR